MEPSGDRDTMHLVCIGNFLPERSPGIEALRTFAEAFFGCSAQFLESIQEKEVSQRRRELGYGEGSQLHTHDIRDLLVRIPKPANSFCVVAITMTDLYSSSPGGINWNFVYGQASLTDGVGVFSFARFLPNGMSQQAGLDAVGRKLLLKRSCKVVAHETAHILGLRHCTYHHCIMNGFHHLAEFDAAPMFMCPVCMRRFVHATKCAPMERYHALRAWYQEHGLEGECNWITDRIAEIELITAANDDD